MTERTEVYYNDCNTLPEQVEENTQNIKVLEQLILTSTNNRGKWISGTSYNVKDSVYLNSGLYICKKQVLDSTVTPNLDEEHFITVYKNTYGQEIQVNTNIIRNLRTEVDANETRLHTAEDSITRIDEAITNKYVNCRVLKLQDTDSLTFNQFQNKPKPYVKIVGHGTCEIRNTNGVMTTFTDFQSIDIIFYANELYATAILKNNTVKTYESTTTEGNFYELRFSNHRGGIYIFNDYVNFVNPASTLWISEEEGQVSTLDIDNNTKTDMQQIDINKLFK